MARMLDAGKKPGVLLVTPFFHPNIGGVETHLTDLCNALDNDGYVVDVLTYFPLTTRVRNVPGKEVRGNLTIRRRRLFGHDLFHRLEKYPPLALLYLMPVLLFHSVVFMVRHHGRIDVVHAHGFVASLIARLVGRLFGKRIVMSTHAIYDLGGKRAMASVFRWILKPYDKVLTLSDPSRDELLAAGVDGSKLGRYVYWVDQDVFRPGDKAACKGALGLEGRFVVLFVGRLIEIKGIRELVRAATLCDQGVTFVIAGVGPLEGYLREVASRAKNIMYVGPIDNAKLAAYYNAADIFVVPSQYEEGLGRVIIESLSCGTPVVASNRGGIPEAVNADVGVLVEPTAEELARGIQGLHSDRDELERLARNCRRHAMERFGVKNVGVIEDAYRED